MRRSRCHHESPQVPQPQGMKKPPETTRSEDEPKIARVQVAHPECYPARYAVGLPRRQGVSACGPRRNEPVEASSSCWHLLTERTSALLSGTCVRSGIFPARGCLAAFGECGWARLTPKWWAPYWASPKGTTVTGSMQPSHESLRRKGFHSSPLLRDPALTFS